LDRRPPWVVGVAGPSCAGKSSLARALSDALRDAVVVSLDAWYRDLAALPAALRQASNFDHPDALDAELMLAQLGALASGVAVDVPVYDFATHTRAGCRRVTPGDVLIVEGLLAFHWPALRNLFDLRVWVDLDDDACLERRVRRDVAARGRTRASVLEQYARTVAPMRRRFVEPGRAFAHVVVDGALAPEDGVRRVLRAPEVPPRFSANLLK